MAQRKVILRAIFYFFCPFRLALAPTIFPWVFEDDFRTAYRFIMHICVRNYCMHNKYMGCTEISLPLVHISGCPTEAKKTIILNAVSITACLVHKVLKFLVCVTHDIMTWLGIFTAANALSLSVPGYKVTNTYLIRVRDCKWRNCIKIY